MTTAARRIEGHAIALDHLFHILNTDEHGLSEDEVIKRLETIGPNEIPQVKGSIWEVYLAPLFNWLITTYLVMTGILFVLALAYPEAWTQVVMWLSIVAINFAIAIIQQARAQKKLDALHKLAPAITKTFRDGIITRNPTERLVPGDIIELFQGDRISADSRIIKSNVFLVNEASLTGESVPVSKVEDGSIVLEEDTDICDRKNMIYRGTFVQMGNAQAVVVNTGANTEIGKIQTELGELQTGEIPLRDKVNTLGRALTIGAVTFLLIQLIWLMVNWDDDMILAEELVNAVITSMSVMPINIPLLTTIVLLTGVLAMATHRVIIRNLGAIESLGRISILCSDKTGTITKSQMTVKRIWVNEQLYGVTGMGYGPSGVIFPLKAEPAQEIDESYIPDDFLCCPPGSAIELLVTSGMLNNDATLIVEDYVEVTGQTSWKHTGNPTDAALLALCKKTNIDKINVMQKFKLLREFPFDSSLKRMTKLFDEKDGGYIVFSKGATEMLLPLCTRTWTQFGIEDMTPDQKMDIQSHVNQYAMLGYRVLSFAFKRIGVPPQKGPKERETIESDLIFLGFICLVDPPREDVREAVEECISAGITPIMITGDSMVTGGTIAKKIGLLRPGQNANVGNMAAELDQEEFQKTVVFGRVAPKDKQVIVERYQQNDRVVAMTGDGVNDALALSMADAGIAMGIAGTEVAKQASDIIIADDAFSSIVTGVREGRGLFHKIRIMIFFYICVNLAEGLVYFGSSFIPDFELLTSWQKIYIFSIAHSLPPLAIIFDRFDKGIMKRSPIDGEGIFSKRLITALFLTAAALAIVIYFGYFLTEAGIIAVTEFNKQGFIPEGVSSLDEWQLTKARTMMHTIIYLCESVLVLSIRRIDKSLLQSFKEDSYWLAYVFVLSLPIIHLCMMYIPGIQEFLFELLSIDFNVIQLSPTDWGICIAAAVIPIVLIELHKWETRRRGLHF